MRIGVVGNRSGWDEKFVHSVLDRFVTDEDMIVSGGANGVDSFAQSYAKKKGLPILIYYPDWERNGKSAGMVRNTMIARDSDWLIAFNNKIKSGTMNTVRNAGMFKKKVILIGEHGEETRM